MSLIHAPFTATQVDYLNAWQRDGRFHPFTCASRGDGHHEVRPESDLGSLVATEAGWVCHDCDYTQDWAHDFMADQREWV